MAQKSKTPAKKEETPPAVGKEHDLIKHHIEFRSVAFYKEVERMVEQELAKDAQIVPGDGAQTREKYLVWAAARLGYALGGIDAIYRHTGDLPVEADDSLPAVEDMISRWINGGINADYAMEDYTKEKNRRERAEAGWAPSDHPVGTPEFRLKLAIEKLSDPNLAPRPYDLYYAKKNHDGRGWIFLCLGFGISDMKAILRHLEDYQRRIIEKSQQVESLEAQVKDLKTKLVAGGEVYGIRVKPLEWKKPIPNSESESGYGAGRSEYPLIQTENGWRVYCIPGEGGMEFPTKEAAKAAAQADFERRILSALEATPSAALEAQLAARTGRVKPLDEDDYEEIISAAAINMKKATSGLRGQVVTVQDNIDWWVMKETERRILSALGGTPGAAGDEVYDMRVKPLEWKPAGNNAGKDGLWFVAIDAFGKRHEVIRSYHGQKGAGWTYGDTWYRNLDEAKEAAVNAVRVRILSALEVTPAVTEAWQVKDHADGWIDFATAEEALAEVRVRGSALIRPALTAAPEGGE